MNAFAKKLMVGAAVAALVLSMGSTGRAQGKDIVDTAVGAGQFKTLAAALATPFTASRCILRTAARNTLSVSAFPFSVMVISRSDSSMKIL